LIAPTTPYPQITKGPDVATKLALTLTCGDYEITRPLADGSVEPDGIALTVLTNSASRDRHWRLARNAECDLGEFNACAYFMARERGHPYIALPIYPHRRFRHGFVFVNTGKGITQASDLRGRRIGCYGGFQPAACVWLRGLLEEFHGLPHRDVTWVIPRLDEIAFTPAPGLKIEVLPPGKSLDDMLAAGEIDAMLAPSFPAPFLKGDKRVARLFPDFKAREIDYYRQTGIFPIMHVIMIRQSIVEQHPWVPANLAYAFNQAKQMAYARLRNPRALPQAWNTSAGEEQAAILGPDPWAYGLGAANAKNLTTGMRYTHAQGLTERLATLEEVFVPIDEGIFSGVGGY
jgi:4,5-dihydroxyphthalate decarboxylase